MSRSEDLRPIVTAAPVIPVVVLEDAELAVPLARALVAGGLRVIEITLRTGAAIGAIEAIAGEVEGAIVGAGTVLSKGQLIAAARAGARFIVSPGINADLLKAAEDSPVPFLPGAATASEVMSSWTRATRSRNSFPPRPAGGIAYLKALASPLPVMRFCPTGGIDADNAAGLSGTRQRRLRRRLLGDAEGCARDGRLGAHRRARAQGVQARSEPVKRAAASQRWKTSAPIAQTLGSPHLRDLFAADPGRFERFSLTLGDLTLDYSKNRIVAGDDAASRRRSPRRPRSSRLRDEMFSGEPINITENRAVLHVALRAPKSADIRVDGDERRARGARGAGAVPRLRRPGPLRRDPRRRRRHVHRRRQHRHRRLRPRAGNGGRWRSRLIAAAARACISSPTSTARTSPTRSPGSTPSARSSSSPRRPSPRRRR